MALKPNMPFIRKWSRNIHRDLSFFFSGVILVYAISGVVLNHKKDFNSDYIIRQHTLQIPGEFPKPQTEFSKEYVLSLLQPLEEEENYTKHYFPNERRMKVFIKGGSSLVVDIQTGKTLYESVKKRPVISALNRLHYNPGKWWTIFSDIFAVSLLIITLTGIVMLKGKKGLWGRGGIELAIGILIPILFIFFT